MADISKIKLPSGTEYQIKDQGARDLIASLNQFTYEVVTELPTAAASTMYKIYLKAASTAGTSDNYEEFITIDKGSSASPRYVWEKLGTITPPDLSNYVSKDEAKALAYKDTASGTVAVPKTYTTTTSIATSESKSVSVSGTTTGSVSLTKSTVDIKPSATGTAANVYKPAGSVSSSFTGTSSSGTISGTATAPTISVKTAGSTTSVTPFGSAGTLPSATMPTYTVASGSETLTITAGSFSAGTLPSAGTAVTVKTGDAAYQAGTSTVSGSCSVTPEGSVSSSFTGTDTYLKTASEVGTAASFTGASMTSTGSVSVPKTFTSSTSTATTESKTVTVS